MKLTTVFLALLLCFNSFGTIIVGEDEKDRFLKINQIGENYYFLECQGSYENPQCDSMFDIPMVFSKWDIKELVSEKYEDAVLAGVADVGVVVGAAIGGLLLGAQATVVWAVGAGASLDGGVAAVGGFMVSMGTTTGAGVATIAIDALDPFVHRDAAIAAKAIIDDADEGDLDDVDGRVINGEKVVFIEDVKYSQVRETFHSMLKEIIEDRDYPFEEILFPENKSSLF